jgi:hypothetical protein
VPEARKASYPEAGDVLFEELPQPEMHDNAITLQTSRTETENFFVIGVTCLSE